MAGYTPCSGKIVGTVVGVCEQYEITSAFDVVSKVLIKLMLIGWFLSFKEVTFVYSENYTNPINTLCAEYRVIECYSRWYI